MKITEELLQKADQIPNFSDGVIMPDGDYRLIEEKGHLQTMMALLPYPEKEIWKMIPENDSALFWMIEKTGCVLTDYNSTVGMAMTQSQKEVFDALLALITHLLPLPGNIKILRRNNPTGNQCIKNLLLRPRHHHTHS